MGQGRHTEIVIRAEARDLAVLQKYMEPYQRSFAVLLLMEGMSIADISRTVGMSRKFVYKWIRRFQKNGIDGLRDQRKGRKKKASAL
jgi:transposase